MPAGLASLSPFGPIFSKELRTTARRRRTYLLRLLFLGGLAAFLLLTWSIDYQQARYGAQGVAARTQREAELAWTFFICVSMFAVVAMALVAPVLTSTSISSERLQKTLPVLLMTPITAWQIVSGKLSSRLLIALMLLALALPVMALVRLMGGVELVPLFAVLAISASTAVMAASVGLFFSTLMNRAYAVILLSYALLLILYLFVPFIVMANTANDEDPAVGRRAVMFLGATNPFMATGMLVSNEPEAVRVQWWWCVACNLGLAAMCVLCSALLLRRYSRREGLRPSAVNPEDYIPLAAATAGVPTAAPAQAPKLPARKPRPSRTVDDNPVLWREVRRPLMPNRWQRWVGAIACLLLVAISYYSLATGRRNELLRYDTHIGFAFIFYGIATLLVCVLSATAIAQEKETDTWALLITAPLAGRAIILGKVAGVFRKLLWPAALMAAHFSLFMVLRVIDIWAVLAVLWILFSFNSLWIATGLYLSLRLRKVTLAVILNLLLPVLVYVFLPMFFVIIGELFVGMSFRGGGPRVQEWGLWTEPFWYLGTLSQFEYRNSLDLPAVGRVGADKWAAALVLIGTAHVVAAAAIVWWMIRRFDPYVSRAQNLGETRYRGFEPLPPGASPTPG